MEDLKNGWDREFYNRINKKVNKYFRDNSGKSRNELINNCPVDLGWPVGEGEYLWVQIFKTKLNKLK